MAACGGDRVVGAEPWAAPPEIRVAVIGLSGAPVAQVLDGTDPLVTQIPEGESADLWLLSYRADTLRAAFPGLRGLTVPEIIARLAPAIGGAGEVPPAADEVLFAPVGEGFAGLEYSQRPWPEWERAGLALRLELPNEAVCGEASSTVIDVPTGLQINGLVAIGRDRAMVSATPRSDVTGPIQLLLLDQGALTPVVTRTERGPASPRPTWDRATGTVWDIDGAGRVFRYDVDGREQPAPPKPAEPAAQDRARRISAGTDGTVMATFDVRYMADGVSRTGESLFTLQNGQWTTTRVLDGRFGLLDVVRSDRLIAYYLCWVYQFRDPVESSGWKQSVLDNGCFQRGIRDVTDIDLDGDGGVVVGNGAYVVLRDDARGTWERAGEGLPADEDFGLALAMGGGSALIGSNAGKLFFRRAGRWCPITVNGLFDRGSSAPEGSVAFLVSAQGDRVMRVQLP